VPITGDWALAVVPASAMTGDGANCRGLPDHVVSIAAMGYRRLLSIAGERAGYLGSPAVIAGDHMPRDCGDFIDPRQPMLLGLLMVKRSTGWQLFKIFSR